jgi:hypothetical protein
MILADDRRRLPGIACAAAVVAALALSGCGSEAPSPRQPRALPMIVSTAITTDGVSLSPNHLGAGLVKLVITNMTAASQQLAVASTTTGAFRQETAPINPQDTAQLRARLGPGRYTVSVKASGVKSANLAVGSTASAQP